MLKQKYLKAETNVFQNLIFFIHDSIFLRISDFVLRTYFFTKKSPQPLCQRRRIPEAPGG